MCPIVAENMRNEMAEMEAPESKRTMAGRPQKLIDTQGRDEVSEVCGLGVSSVSSLSIPRTSLNHSP